MDFSVYSAPTLVAKNQQGASKTTFSPSQQLRGTLSDDVMFSGDSRSKASHKSSFLKAGLFAFAALLFPSWAMASQEASSNDSFEIPASLKSDHRPTSPTCPDDDQRPAEVAENLRGSKLISAEQVALAEYLEPRTVLILTKPNPSSVSKLPPTDSKKPSSPNEANESYANFFNFMETPPELAKFIEQFKLPNGQYVFPALPQELLPELEKSTENFQTPKNNPEPSPPRGQAGTGFICQEDGLILTNHHVIEKVEEGGEIVVDLGTKRYQAKLIATDPYVDLAFLKIDTRGEKLPTLSFAPEVKKGELVASMGNPTGFKNVMNIGDLSALYQVSPPEWNDPSPPFHIVNSAVNKGNSGGASVNIKGEMLGQLFAKSADPFVEGQGYVAPQEYIEGAINRLHAGKPIDNRLSIGIDIRPLHEMTFLSNKDIQELAKGELEANELKIVRDIALGVSERMDETFGVSVGSIIPTGANGEPTLAASSGNFQLGDVIVAVNGQSFESMPQFIAQVKSIFQDEAFELTLIRDGKKKTVSFPGESKDNKTS